MKKRIVICADGTWNRPEKDLSTDQASNVLRMARAIAPLDTNNVAQQVFYDWGVGSYYDTMLGGMTGRGLHKNIVDCYRYIVQNYQPGDDIYLFGFSRGAYTVRSLCGLINNCGIVKRAQAQLIHQAFEHYKKPSSPYAPKGAKSVAFKQQYSHPSHRIAFVGVWDTVGAMGIPNSFLGLFDDSDEFYDTKIGSNVAIARHALAIDEHRQDFKPTLWQPRDNLDMQQVWFAGAHSNVGGSYLADKNGQMLSDNALQWMVTEAQQAQLYLEAHLVSALSPTPMAKLHQSRRSFYRIKAKHYRPLDPNIAPVLIHSSVKQRWDNDPKYRPQNLKEYIEKFGWPKNLIP
ncbi:DUF2235 domain-containing protein [Shewanella intestini]|uniref:DUF2235 domain-containing protein n=1 Tax=Shewanella intestini TaxID=2017544 RepID=A0ABS5I362_9GAMM|nr:MULTISPECIES: DUF2235 domain-containing protein [Shewanella]MBR9728472.1 DUF2235 domain-containing protein [Shewanella intestini]MRG36291.1 DUF2235 domain-containing protein [Shewanella sp. XMDDZSB0408]